MKALTDLCSLDSCCTRRRLFVRMEELTCLSLMFVIEPLTKSVALLISGISRKLLSVSVYVFFHYSLPKPTWESV